MSTVKIGWAKRDISTTEPVNINGQAYLRISEGIHDPIYVTALCVDGGEGQDAVVFVSCDVTSIHPQVWTVMQEKLPRVAPHIPLSSVVLNATHTHSSSATFNTEAKSPDGKDIYPGEKYRDFFTDRICEAIVEAWDNRKPGGISFGYGYAVVAHSRRSIYMEDQATPDILSLAPNGRGVMYGATNQESFSHYEAGADHFVNVMFTMDENDKLTGMIVNVPCPSQVSECFLKLSADYWCEVRKGVAKEYGEDVFVLPQCGAAGDLSPRILHYGKAQRRRFRVKYDLDYCLTGTKPGFNEERYKKIMGERYDIAERILSAVRDVYGWAMKEIYRDIPVRHVAEDVPLTRRIITDEEAARCRELLAQLETVRPDPKTMSAEDYRKIMSRKQSVYNRNVRALDRHELLKTEPKKVYPLYVTQIGPVAFAFNPFELYMDYMHRIQARSPFVQTFVCQLAGGGGSSYLPTERGVMDKGYSASIYCNQIGPEGGQELVEFTLGVLNRFAEEN